MGLSRTWTEVIAKTQRFEVGLSQIPARAVGASALAVKRAVMSELGSPSGTAVRLRGVGKKGAKIGVKYTVHAAPANAIAVVHAVGPFHLIERDVKRHSTRPRSNRRKRGRRRVVVVPGVGPREFGHASSKGKHPWAKGVNKAAGQTVTAFRLELEREMRRAF